jgi:hypothetical protein
VIARVAVSLCLGALLLAAIGCGGATTESNASPGGSFASGLELLPDDPQLHRHVLVSDLARLRRAYPKPSAYEAALVGVWLPDALVGTNGALWRRATGLRLEEVTSFAAAGFHPAEVAVALGQFAPTAMRSALRRSGFRERGDLLVHGEDGSFDATTEVGRLALSALNRVGVGPERVVAASTSALAEAAASPSRTLAQRPEFAAVAAALAPITSSIVLDAQLVRPPSGVPVRVLPERSARLVGVGIDDLGPADRTLKIALVYDDPADARADAPLIEQALPTTPLPGTQGERFEDLAAEWRVAARDRAVVISARLPRDGDPGAWRWLVERGDLGPLVRPEG